MNGFLVIGVLIGALLVLAALARGLYHFAQGHQASLNGTVQENQLAQNRMMIARVKWQAITILLLIVIGVFAASG